MPTEPTKELLRRSDVLTWLGIDFRELATLVKKGVIRPIQTYPGARYYYKKSQLKVVYQLPELTKK